MTFTAARGESLAPERRIGVQYMRDHQIVGIAWRTLIAVRNEAEVATVIARATRENALLDLQPLLGNDIPDLTVSVCQSDALATGEFVWTAFVGDESGVTVPDMPRISYLDSSLGVFVSEMRQAIAFSQGPYSDYLTMAGKARQLGRAIPPGIQQVIADTITQPGRTTAPSILLLSEELTLPWELAALQTPMDTAWGGTSPFLGAQAAISRWPLTERRPRPTPRAKVTVRRAAVLSADYQNVHGWPRIEHARAEAAEIAALFSPPAIQVRPTLRDVVNVLRGIPPADVLHVALHGQFDAQGAEEGLVLLGTDGTGELTGRSQFLTPVQVETGVLEAAPFIFLNACQVASDKRVLGDYGGFASTLLRIGAAGVLAPLWNVDDDIAATFAHDFYAATWIANGEADKPPPVSVAEAVRALRALYTEAAADAATPGISATLIAFQVFAHPRLTLGRAS
jgi:hypothetical protein